MIVSFLPKKPEKQKQGSLKPGTAFFKTGQRISNKKVIFEFKIDFKNTFFIKYSPFNLNSLKYFILNVYKL